MSTADDKRLRSLIKGCRKWKRDSQKLLYKEFYAYSMSICLRYSSTKEEASEILNDAFMKVFTHIKKFDIARPFKPWLRQILINTAINQYKKSKMNIATESIKDYGKEDVDEKILSGISYQEIVDMIQQLPPAYRTVFNLFVIEGYKHEEIAEQLGIDVGTSKSNLFKAKAKLRIILKDFFNDDYVRTER